MLQDTEDVEEVQRDAVPKQGMLLLIFIHGYVGAISVMIYLPTDTKTCAAFRRFKGSETTTFADFPSRLSHIVSQTLTTLEVRPIIYPTYDTRGSLSKAVEGFVDWLTTTCVGLESKPEDDVEKQAESGRGKGSGTVKVILCGHSMGGLVAVDAALEISKSGGVQKGKLWPRVCGIIAFDTPVSRISRQPKIFD
jgi:pimeloyl-ACP methyl ester carboxylesterase